MKLKEERMVPKTRVIKVKELDDYLLFAKLEAELVLELKGIVALQEQAINKMERVKNLCCQIKPLQRRHKIKTTPEIANKIFYYTNGVC